MSETQRPNGVMRGAFETTGSCRLVMYVIKKLELDAKHGFLLDIRYVKDEVQRSLESVEVALQEGSTDIISIDWISVARERAHGIPITAGVPYGRTIGGLVARQDSSIQSLEDLPGKRIGVVRKVDKNWIITRAACLKRYGFDPQREATVVEALSKSKLTYRLETGDVEAGLQFWQLIPHLTVSGKFRQVVDMIDLLPYLGVQKMIPFSIFTFRDEFVQRQPQTIRAYARAFADAVDYMKQNDDIWEELREKMLPEETPEVVHALRDRWRARVMTNWNEETIRNIKLFFEEMLKVGGKEVLGVDRIPEGTFTLGLTA
ncbi:MAG TPA: ABC transporter substrate-binding protein [Candidatus Limnocylindrales bacterium]|nr:ABC transporter substrate-binding protein [Candidatus Limnocylindrales bacterium]